LGLDPVSIGTVKLDGIPMIESGIAAFRENVRGLLDDPAVLRIDALSLLRSGFLTRGRLGADLERLTLELEQVSLTLGLRDSDLNSPLCDADEQTLVLICIALLVALGPKLLVLDDPARCLNRERRTLLAQLLVNRQCAGMGLLLACRDEFFLAECCRDVLVLFDGQIQGQGTVEDVLPAASNQRKIRK
jgi:ABC-type uncharacterized transport system ATPase subunit